MVFIMITRLVKDTGCASNCSSRISSGSASLLYGNCWQDPFALPQPFRSSILIALVAIQSGYTLSLITNPLLIVLKQNDVRGGVAFETRRKKEEAGGTWRRWPAVSKSPRLAASPQKSLSRYLSPLRLDASPPVDFQDRCFLSQVYPASVSLLPLHLMPATRIQRGTRLPAMAFATTPSFSHKSIASLGF